MELPNDIWYTIVNQSKKSNTEFIKEMDLDGLNNLKRLITEKENKIYDNIGLNNYDIIKVTHRTDNDAYKCDLLITNSNLKNKSKISVSDLKKGNKKCIFGYYKKISYNENFLIDLYDYNIQVISTLAERNKENIDIANSLKIGNIICVSDYTSKNLCRFRGGINVNNLYESNYYSVVHNITPQKIFLKTKTKLRQDGRTTTTISDMYVNKNVVLKKINYNDNNALFIKCKRSYYLTILNLELKQNYSKTNKLYNIGHIQYLINLQKKYGMRKS